ncbi:hypothetical protein Tco_0592170, partial [Tanacetum coccineum]
MYQFIFQRRTPATEEASTGPSTQPQDETSAKIGTGSNKINSGGDTKILHIVKELGEDVTDQVNLEEKTAELDQ